MVRSLFEVADESRLLLGVLVQAFNPSTWAAETGEYLCDFQVSLVYQACAGTIRAVTQRNPDAYINK